LQQLKYLSILLAAASVVCGDNSKMGFSASQIMEKSRVIFAAIVLVAAIRTGTGLFRFCWLL